MAIWHMNKLKKRSKISSFAILVKIEIMKNRSYTTSGMDWNTMIGSSDRLERDGLHRDYL